MGFSGCNIPGHSGTANKPRKPFFKSKYYKASKVSTRTNSATSSILNPYYERPKGETRTDKLVKYFFKVPLVILGSLVLLFIIRYYTKLVHIDLDLYQVELNADLAEFEKELKSQQALGAYDVLVKDGFRYLKLAEYEKAQYEFTIALNLFEDGKRARIGLYTALSQQCVLHNRYCEEANENLEYLKSSGWDGK